MRPPRSTVPFRSPPPARPDPAGAVFRRDPYLATLEPPLFDTGDRILVGRILSADEWFGFEDRLHLAGQDVLTRDGLRALMEEMTDLTFAPIVSGRWPFRRETKVSTLLFALPWSAQLETFRSFTLAQAQAQQGTTLRAMAETMMRPTRGTRSDG